ncbi:MAG: aspartate-semialdehyde dehydrogenase [Spirochaetes bacterium RBG_13_68_11]|nr:MAG: aspartate-semialdehyde dehydrogenase [Spirochaetes bacterium RBG_13_68_11]
MADRLKVGIVGATGMVGQRFVSLLADHPWFQVTTVAASERSTGKSYAEAVGARWAMPTPVPPAIAKLTVKNAAKVDEIAGSVDFVFCAVDMPKDEIRALEDRYAKAETPVVSNNSAHRWTPDVPMLLPEVNPGHLSVIDAQKKRLGARRGFIVVKPNCSIQSYVPALHPLREFGIEKVFVCTYQAISGAGKTFKDWPEMVDNVIPFIGGEEEKSENEPLKVWGTVEGGTIVVAKGPVITSQCIRVPVSDGHLAAVSVSFARKPSKDQIIDLWKTFEGQPQQLGLPSAPKPFLTYFTEEDRPQTRLDRDAGAGMGITVGRLREDRLLDWRFVCLSHNTIRGAAGGAVLTAELLKAEGRLAPK